MLEGEGIGLVEEDHALALLPGHREDLRQELTRSGAELGGEIHELEMVEDGARLGGQRAREEGLAGAGRPEEQHALGRCDAPLTIELGVGQGRAQASHDALGLPQPADLLEGGVGMQPHLHPTGQIAELLSELGEDVFDAPLDGPLLAVWVELWWDGAGAAARFFRSHPARSAVPAERAAGAAAPTCRTRAPRRRRAPSRGWPARWRRRGASRAASPSRWHRDRRWRSRCRRAGP